MKSRWLFALVVAAALPVVGKADVAPVARTVGQSVSSVMFQVRNGAISSSQIGQALRAAGISVNAATAASFFAAVSALNPAQVPSTQAEWAAFANAVEAEHVAPQAVVQRLAGLTPGGDTVLALFHAPTAASYANDQVALATETVGHAELDKHLQLLATDASLGERAAKVKHRLSVAANTTAKVCAPAQQSWCAASYRAIVVAQDKLFGAQGPLADAFVDNDLLALFPNEAGFHTPEGAVSIARGALNQLKIGLEQGSAQMQGDVQSCFVTGRPQQHASASR